MMSRTLSPAVAVVIMASKDDVARARGREFAASGGGTGDLRASGVVAGEAVVVELVVAEKRAAMAVETIGPELAGARFVFGHQEPEAVGFLSGGWGFAGDGLIEFRVAGAEGEQELCEREGDLFRRDAFGAEGGTG